HRLVAAALELPIHIEHIGDAPTHTRGEVTPGRPQHHSHTARHVLTAMVAYAFHHADGAAVANSETLARQPASKHLAAGGAIQAGIANDNVLLRHERGILRREYHNAPTADAFAHVVVRVTLQRHGDSLLQERAEALSRR